MDQLLGIRVFRRIVEARSFTKAAAQLGLPRSTVSKALLDLKTHLATQLIQRTTRSVSLTPEGAEYLRRTADIEQQLDEADAVLRGMGAEAKGRLRIDVYASFARSVLIPALRFFQIEHPDLQLVIGIGDRPVNLVEEGVDCAVRAGELADSSMVAKTLLNDQLVTCASPAYLQRHGTPQLPEDLNTGHRLVGYFGAKTSETWPLQFTRRNEARSLARFDLMANDSAAQIDMLADGFGIGQTHRLVIQKHLNSGSLVPVLADWTNQVVPISALFPSARQRNPRAKAFVEWLGRFLNRTN